MSSLKDIDFGSLERRLMPNFVHSMDLAIVNRQIESFYLSTVTVRLSPIRHGPQVHKHRSTSRAKGRT